MCRDSTKALLAKCIGAAKLGGIQQMMGIPPQTVQSESVEHAMRGSAHRDAARRRERLIVHNLLELRLPAHRLDGWRTLEELRGHLAHKHAAMQG